MAESESPVLSGQEPVACVYKMFPRNSNSQNEHDDSEKQVNTLTIEKSTQTMKHQRNPSTASTTSNTSDVSTASAQSVASAASESFLEIFSEIEDTIVQGFQKAISESDIPEQFDNIPQLDPLSPTLISATSPDDSDKTSLSEKRRSTFTFFHESARDRCAGIYFAQQDSAWVMTTLQQLQTLDDVLNHAWILRFASGANTEVAQLIIERLLQVYQDDEEIHMAHPRYYEDVVSARKWRTIQRYIELCLACNYESGSRAQITNQLSQLFQSGRIYFLGMSPATVTHFGYYLSHLDASSVIESMKISRIPKKGTHYRINEGPTSRLYETYKSNFGAKYSGFPGYRASEKLLYGQSIFTFECYEQLWKFYDNWPSGGEDNMAFLFESLQGKTLRTLDISGVPMYKQFRSLVRLIETGKLASLEDLQLNRTNLEEKHISQLEILGNLKNLRILGISENKAGDSLLSVVKGLTGMSLEKLDIADMDVPAQTMKTVIGRIKGCTQQLSELKIHGNGMNDESVKELRNQQTMQALQKVEVLSFAMFVQNETVQNEMVLSMGCFQHLQELSVHRSTFPESLLQDISRYLDNLHSLHIIYLDAEPEVNISSKSAQDFISWMKTRKCLTRMTLLRFILLQDDLQSLLQACTEKQFEYLG